ncbi:hypothetical protein MtrunA17_Chr8g0335051 [Medicago truncatula]|uniref:Uncharacterized protein n=1 Tax=Medicago truncatula TaxID=3880 RepID=A0A396GDB5_MEDTR|nr:hypothetical protein MtrunA17_Chr8g0335051 [Medicago truncatula]
MNMDNFKKDIDELIAQFTQNLTKYADIFHEVQGNADDPHKSSLSVCDSEQNSTACLQNASMLSDQYIPTHSASEPTLPENWRQSLVTLTHSSVESSGANNCSSSENQQLTCTDVSKPDPVKMEHWLGKNKCNLQNFIQKMSWSDLIYFQHRLLQEAVAKKRLAGVCIILY